MNQPLAHASLAPATLTLAVARVTVEAEGVRAFELRDPAGGALPPFTAGAHLDVLMRPGLSRCYSLCNDPAERDRYVIAVALDPASRGGSRHMHASVQAGDLVTVTPPRNAFPLADAAGTSVLVAGGIGITPLLAMARQLSREGRPFALHYAARSRGRAAFLEAVAALPAGSAVVALGDDPATPRLDIAAIVAGLGRLDHVYACGPARMLAAFDAATAGLPRDRVHVERFSPVSPPAAGGFTVALARRGAEVFVPEDSTILDVLLDEGLDLPFSCQQGLCGSCRTRVLEGEPDHRDEILTREERAAGTTMMICCSGAKGDRLVLDL